MSKDAESRTGIWELSYEKPESQICLESGAAWIYGRGLRSADKPLAIIYSDEILFPTGVTFEIVAELGALRLRIIDNEAKEDAEAMEDASKDNSENIDFLTKIFKRQAIEALKKDQYVAIHACGRPLTLEDDKAGVCPGCGLVF